MIDLQPFEPPQSFRDLTVFPLVCSMNLALPYDLLSEAMEEGTLTIEEIGSGSVPELMAGNEGDTDVLVLDGEQVIGMKQNRTMSRTVLLPGKTRTKIPVSCMERGRWSRGERNSRSGPQHSPLSVRREARDLEARHAREGRSADPGSLSAAQSAVWSQIDHLAADLDATSETAALDEVYRRRRVDLDEAEASFPPVEGQVGLLAFLGDRPLGLDVIGGQALYGRLHRRFIRGYLLDALRGRGAAAETRRGADERGGVDASRAPAPTPDAALQFLGEVREATRDEAPTVGRGTYRVLTGAVVGGELLDGERLPHLSAFPARGGRGGGKGTSGGRSAGNPIPGPSRRRGRGNR